LQGDALLVSIAKVLKKVTRRSGDLVFRMGGEEFGILLPNTAYDWALSFAERVRLEIAEMRVPLINGTEETSITVSVGVACVIPRPGESSDTLMKLADNNLYKAKDMGRNRVVG
jgi:diguanylate cyclase (GGDEF)-like protein